jgi:hypothetical protein
MLSSVQLSLLLCSLLASTEAFVPAGHSSRSISIGWGRQQTARSAISLADIQDVGYSVAVKKPLGIVFGENPAPFDGLVVDDVEPGLNGGAAGLRVGDQLLSINGQVVIGSDFDSAMELLRNSESASLDLMLFRGPARALYTIIENRNAIDEDEDEEEQVEGQVFDENYESPVQVSIAEDEEPLNVADVLKGFFAGDEKKDKKKGGFFAGMFSEESIQLDGSDADTLK